MQRSAFALLVGLGLLFALANLASAQEKAEKGPPPKGMVDHVVIENTAKPLYVITYKLSFPEMVFAFLVLFALTMIFFQLLLVRSVLEKILERQGGTP